MKIKKIHISIFLAFTTVGLLCFLPHQGRQEPLPLPVKKADLIASKKTKENPSAPKPVKPATTPPVEKTQKTVKPKKPKPPEKMVKVQLKRTATNPTTLIQIPFEKLPGWDQASMKRSFAAFRRSCHTFLKQAPNHSLGSTHINMKAGDWHPACKAAMNLKPSSDEEIRSFFETWFKPAQLTQKRPSDGLFTGYYVPELHGSLSKTKQFHTPIYGIPQDLIWKKNHTGHYFTRAQIDQGAILKKAPVIAWVHSPIDRLFMEIEGTGAISLPNGERFYVNYAAANGAPYTSISSILIKKGVMTRDTASKKAITRYLKEHPKVTQDILHKNQSFVFFQKTDKPQALGAQGMPLTPGYSLAIDRSWIPLGTPLWLKTKKPDTSNFQRLMIAQDTGGAIKGLMRGDVYWGTGAKASFLGEHMKNAGRFWLLLPKHLFEKLVQGR